jgi:hypothetical protein
MIGEGMLEKGRSYPTTPAHGGSQPNIGVAYSTLQHGRVCQSGEGRYSQQTDTMHLECDKLLWI